MFCERRHGKRLRWSGRSEEADVPVGRLLRLCEMNEVVGAAFRQGRDGIIAILNDIRRRLHLHKWSFEHDLLEESEAGRRLAHKFASHRPPKLMAGIDVGFTVTSVGSGHG